jgi:hypothetical protein
MSQQIKHRLPLISRHWGSLKKEILESRKADKVSGYLFNHRFLLVIHKSESGKILSATETSRSLLRSGKIQNVIILSLTEDFKREMINYGITRDINDYTFYTYNKFIRSKIDDLSDSLLIIDEAHNLSILENMDKNVVFALKTAGKVLILTGSPINILEETLINIFPKKFREVF